MKETGSKTTWINECDQLLQISTSKCKTSYEEPDEMLAISGQGSEDDEDDDELLLPQRFFLHLSLHEGRQQLDDELEQQPFFLPVPFIATNTSVAITNARITSIMKSITPGSVQAIVYMFCDLRKRSSTFTRSFLSFYWPSGSRQGPWRTLVYPFSTQAFQSFVKRQSRQTRVLCVKRRSEGANFFPQEEAKTQTSFHRNNSSTYVDKSMLWLMRIVKISDTIPWAQSLFVLSHW